jgi:hypothetical protein
MLFSHLFGTCPDYLLQGTETISDLGLSFSHWLKGLRFSTTCFGNLFYTGGGVGCKVFLQFVLETFLHWWLVGVRFSTICFGNLFTLFVRIPNFFLI